MIRVCADCKGFIGYKEPMGDKRLTHGLCEKCLEKIEQEFEHLREEQPGLWTEGS
jgi:hypothetical protein